MLLKDIIKQYASMQTPEWKKLSERSRVIYSRELQYLSEVMGDKPITKISRRMVIGLRDSLYDTPGKCRSVLAVLSAVMRYAYDRDIVPVNHVHGLTGMPKSIEIEPWTESEMVAFLFHAPIRLRQAFTLALYTGQRRSDLIKMKWEDYDGTSIRVTQTKTGRKLFIPVHPELKAMLDGMEREGAYILRNHHGDKWAANSISVAFLRQLRDLEIAKSLHGLRKTAAVKLAEAGCTPHQIAAVTGHASLRMVEHYTKGASQRKLAEQAIGAWE